MFHEFWVQELHCRETHRGGISPLYWTTLWFSVFVSVWSKGRFFSGEKEVHVPVGTSTFLNCKYKKAEPSLELERSENCPCLYAKEISFCSYFCRSIARNSEDSSCLHLDDDIKSSAKVESNIHQKLIQMGKKMPQFFFVMENRSSQSRETAV